MDCSTGSMEPTTRASGRSTKPKARVLSGTLKEISTRASSRTTWLMATVSTLILTVASMSVNSKTTSKTDKESRSGWTELATKATIKMA